MMIRLYFARFVGSNVLVNIRNDAISKFCYFDTKFFDEHKTGELLSRVMNDAEKAKE